MQAKFRRSIHAVCVVAGALSLGGCEYLVVDEKGNHRYVDWFTDHMRPGERLVALPATIGPGFPITRPGDPTRTVAYVATPGSYPTERWAVGVSLGATWGKGEMNHFFPAANTNSSYTDFTATGTVEYSRAFNYNPTNGTVVWGRFGFDVVTPTSGNSSPNFGGEILNSHIGWQFTPKVGVSVQFTEQNGKTSGIFPINHCVWLMGGPTWASLKDSFAGESHSKTATGWTIGAGLDFNYANNWTARVGVSYTDLGTNTVPLPGGDVKVDHTDWSVKFGLFKRFETYAEYPVR